jgi:magnesium chelatase family protein
MQPSKSPVLGVEERLRKGKLLAVEADETAGLLADLVRNWSKPRCNADTDGAILAAIAEPDAEGRALLTRAAERLGLSARAWHRTLRVARTLADLDGLDAVRRPQGGARFEITLPAASSLPSD